MKDRTKEIHAHLDTLAKSPEHARLIKIALTRAIEATFHENVLLDECRLLLLGDDRPARPNPLNLTNTQMITVDLASAAIGILMGMNSSLLADLDENGAPKILSQIRTLEDAQNALDSKKINTDWTQEYVHLYTTFDSSFTALGKVIIENLVTGKVFKDPREPVAIVASGDVKIRSVQRDVIIISGGYVTIGNATGSVDIIAAKGIKFEDISGSAGARMDGSHGYNWHLARLSARDAEILTGLQAKALEAKHYVLAARSVTDTLDYRIAGKDFTPVQTGCGMARMFNDAAGTGPKLKPRSPQSRLGGYRY